MGDLSKEVAEIRQSIADKKREVDKLTGRLDEINTQLKEKFGTSDPKKLQAMADKMSAEIESIRTSLQEAVAELKDKLENKDGIDKPGKES